MQNIFVHNQNLQDSLIQCHPYLLKAKLLLEKIFSTMNEPS